jgi:hypothetical protein
MNRSSGQFRDEKIWEEGDGWAKLGSVHTLVPFQANTSRHEAYHLSHNLVL